VTTRLMTLPSSYGRHAAPMCWLPPWSMGEDFLRKCKSFVLQYVLVRFVTTVAAIPLHALGLYHEGDFAFSVTSIYLWSVIINSISQALALYALVLFYQCCHKELMALRPFSKFFSIKLIIFCSWWQSIGTYVWCGETLYDSCY
jgi:hypothetical protein